MQPVAVDGAKWNVGRGCCIDVKLQRSSCVNGLWPLIIITAYAQMRLVSAAIAHQMGIEFGSYLKPLLHLVLEKPSITLFYLYVVHKAAARRSGCCAVSLDRTRFLADPPENDFVDAKS